MRRPRRTVIMLGTGMTIGSRAPLEGSGASELPKPTPDTPEPSPALLGLSEKAFQAHVVGSLKARGYLVWHVVDSRLMAAGLPDIIAVHPTRVPRRLLMYELKTSRGRVRPEQRAALAALSDVYGVDARVIRPADWLAESATL